MPGFNINTFKSHINATGTLNNSKFLFNIVVPPGLLYSTFNNNGSVSAAYGRQSSDLITFRADTVRTPGVSLATSNIFRYGIGPSERKPFNAAFSDISASFIVDKKADIYVFFYSWFNYIFNFSRGAGGQNTNGALASYTTAYKNYYSTDIEIILYDDSGVKPVQVFRLLQAFPISLSEIPLSWSDKSSLMKMNVSFTFKEYILDNVNQATYTAVPGVPATDLIGVRRSPADPVSRPRQPDTNFEREPTSGATITPGAAVGVGASGTPIVVSP